MKPLRLDEVSPAGWIRHQMTRDLRTGMAGCFNRLRPEFDIDVWIKRRGAANHGEMTGNWLEGYIRMAFLTGDADATARAHDMVRQILDSADADGYLGSYPPDKRYQNAMTAELMMQHHLYVALLAYYEFTGRQEVLDAVVKATRLTMAHYPEGKSMFTPESDVKKHSLKDHNKLKDVDLEERRAGWVDHSLIFLDVLEWLYHHTGDREYLDFGVRMYEDFSSSKMVAMRDLKLGDVLNKRLPFFWHGPHVAEHLRAPTWLATATKNERYQQAADAAYEKLPAHLTPSGSLVSDEHVRNQPGHCDRAYEFCTTSQLATSFIHRLYHSGSAAYGDMAENLVFNAGQASRTPDGKNIHYLTRDTQYSAIEARHGGRRKLSPAHEIGNSCCSANAVRLMPWFASNLWMRRGEGLAAALLGPCRVETEIAGVRVRIDEKTAYPFSERIEFTVSVDEPVQFPLSIRKPAWAENGVRIEAPEAGMTDDAGFIELSRTWQDGDSVVIAFDAPICLQRLSNGEGVLRRGPLMYALPLEASFEKLPREHRVEGFFDYNVRLKREYVATDRFVDADAEECGFEVNRKEDADPDDPWGTVLQTLRGHLRYPGFQGNTKHACELVPLGCSVLRTASFPVWPFAEGDLDDRPENDGEGGASSGL